MSEEKLDKIDRRLTELVGITGNLVTTVREMVAQVKENTEQLKQHTEQLKQHTVQIKSLEQQQKTTSAQLADVVQIVIKTDQRVEAMDKRMEERFDELHNESRIANRKINWASNTSLDAQTRVEDLEVRVSKIEEKISI